MKLLWLLLISPPIRLMSNYVIVVWPYWAGCEFVYFVDVYRLQRAQKPSKAYFEFVRVGYGSAPRWLAAHDIGSELVWSAEAQDGS